jgi:hypothetical protein
MPQRALKFNGHCRHRATGKPFDREIGELDESGRTI